MYTLAFARMNRIMSPFPLADPGGGAHPARAPPNGRGPMILYAQNAIFS